MAFCASKSSAAFCAAFRLSDVCAPNRFVNRSTRPSVSISFWRPVKNGWQLLQISRCSSGLVDRVFHDAPHAHLTHVGLHQALHAFGVGYAGTYARADPLVVRYIRRSNDLNVAALTRRAFPRLARVRLLNRTLLRDLEAADGPADACWERWERWAAQAARERVRLEDCTGNELGQLPAVEDILDVPPAGQPVYHPNDPIAQVQALTQQIRHLSMSLQEALHAAAHVGVAQGLGQAI